jgi:simple sugar transport system permease protein
MPVERQASWRDQIKLGRVLFFSLAFLIAGLLILFNTPNRISDEVTSRLVLYSPSLPEIDEIWRFWEFEGRIERAYNDVGIDVPTVAFAVGVAAFFVAGGVIGLAPRRLAPFPHFERVQGVWLILCGVLIIPIVLTLAAAGQSTSLTGTVAASFRAATPIIIGALAGIWCERSGVVNIAIEGMMLTGAAFGFFAFSIIAESNPGTASLWIGVAVAVVSGGLMALLHAWLCISFRTDQIVSGTVINILALGLTSYLRIEILSNADAAQQTLRPTTQILAGVPLLGALFEWLSDVPIVGEIFFSGKPIFTMMFLLLIITHVVLYYTRWGLRTRAVGENPHAADTLGINVVRNRYINVVIGGCLAGLAGAWFSLETTGTFDDNMTNGAGFIALAAMIFGKWTPFGAAAGGLLFGFTNALQTRFQILDVPVPSQFVLMTPYIATIVVLAGLVGRASAPAADGQPYKKE